MKTLGFTRSISVILVCGLALACVALASPAVLADGAPVCPDFFWQNPLPQGNSLQDIAGADAGTAWAVGDYGTILKTSDGGFHWDCQVSATTSVLHGVAVIDSNTAWVCGEDNVVLRTTDGGRNWGSVIPSIQGDFNSVAALNGQTAWIAGAQGDVGLIQKTTDGGRTWTNVTPPDWAFTDISAADANNVWAVTEFGHFYSSTNGGASWNVKPSPVGSLHNRLQVFSATRVYAVTDKGNFLKTTDGTNFTVAHPSGGKDLKALSFSSPTTGWVVGLGGFIGVTTDGGASWSVQASMVSDILYGVNVTRAGNLFACGMFGQLLRSPGASGPWQRVASGDTDMLLDLASVGDRKAWACGYDGTVLCTDNGGATWTSQPTGTVSTLMSVSAFNASVAWAAGQSGAILRTTDGGASWKTVDPGPAAGVDLLSVSAYGPDAAWVSGWGGLIMKTTDAGKTWQKLSDGSKQALLVKALDGQTAWCARYALDVVMKTVDGGASWTRERLAFTGHDVSLNNLCIVNKDVVMASAYVVEYNETGDFGMVFKTTNGGAKWDAMMKRHADLILYDVGSKDGRNIWTSGLFGVTYRSSDGGASWDQVDSRENDNAIYAVDAADGQTAWLAGNGGYILRTTAPHVYSVSPASALNTGQVRLREVAGNGFQPGMQVKLVQGNRQIAATQVQLTSPYRASCVFDLTGAPEGAWDVVAVNTNGLEGRLARGFNVTSAKNWYLAEGSTGLGRMGSFETWVLLQNPGAAQTTARLTYLTPGGRVAGPKVVLPPESRSTVNVAGTLADAWEVSTLVEADRAIVVERAMYWDSPVAYRASAGGSIGTPFPSNTWYLAEGSTGIGTGGQFDTYVTVANPGNAEAKTAVTFMTPDGLVPGPSQAVAAGTRWTVDVSGWVPDEWSVSARVESDQPVVAERSVYWSTDLEMRSAAHNSIGAAAASTEWYLTEGSTGSGPTGAFETWVIVQNPSGSYANARVEYYTPTGIMAGPELTLQPHSRQTVNVADSVPNQFSVATRVTSDNPVVAERSTYFSTPATYRQAAQSSVGSTAMSEDWDLAEGSTGGDASGSFETWVLVQNPWSIATDVSLTYMTPAGRVAGPTVTVGPWSRVSVNVGDTVPATWSVSTRVTSKIAVAAEAVVYWNAAGVPRQCAEDSIGFPMQ